jgi:hypothetical protein
LVDAREYWLKVVKERSGMLDKTQCVRKVFLVFTAITIACFAASAQDNLKTWEDFDFAHSALSTSQIQGLPLEDLKVLRGLVFGRHGRVFKDAEIKV